MTTAAKKSRYREVLTKNKDIKNDFLFSHTQSFPESKSFWTKRAGINEIKTDNKKGGTYHE